MGKKIVLNNEGIYGEGAIFTDRDGAEIINAGFP